MRNVLVALILTLLSAAAVGADRPPNIILIFADDLGWGDVGFNGRKTWETPNLDRIAREGMLFRRFYTGGVVCTPSRAVLLTGRYTIHNGVTMNNQTLPPQEVTIAEALKPAGYATAHFGKWHLSRMNDTQPTHPLDQGFDEFFGFIGGKHAWEKFPDRLVEGREMKPSQGYGDTLFTDRTLDFIERKKDQPFFVYLAYTASHGVVEAPQEEIDRLRGRFEEIDPSKPINATYAAMITQMDAEIGRILDKLVDLKLDENTMIVFTSDHGATFERIQQGGTYYHDSNHPLRGQKRTLWEGGIRVPGAVRWPARIAPGQVSDEVVHMIDLMPTFCAGAGIEPEAAWKLDGVSLLDVLTRGGKLELRTIFFEWRAEGMDQTAAIRGDLKLILTGGNRPETFNVVLDPSERKTIHAIERETTQRLQRELRAWLETETEQSRQLRAERAAKGDDSGD